MYYPNQRFIADMANIRREYILPENAVGKVEVTEGQDVDIRDIIARGLLPDRHIIIDAIETLGPNVVDDDVLRALLLVKPRVPVMPNDPIAGKSRDRGRRILSPIAGVVVAINAGRILMQEQPQLISLQAGVRGEVVQVFPDRGAVVETTGAIVQGVWGNGRTVINNVRVEPPNGIKSISDDGLGNEYANQIVVTTRPIDLEVLAVAQAREFAGLIAPSMEANLRQTVLETEQAIMLTEGFGDLRMSEDVIAVLRQYENLQATLSAYQPQTGLSRRPELIIHRMSNNPPKPNFRMGLRVGMRVRMTRPPYTGQLGQVVALPNRPLPLENGLRVLCAEISIGLAKTILVPLANLELAGIS